MDELTHPTPSQKPLKETILEVIREYNKTTGFTDRKLTDTPTDGLQIVPRKYVTNNGTSANRPTASVIGQPYLDMTLASGRGKPITWNGIGWIDATGTYV